MTGREDTPERIVLAAAVEYVDALEDMLSDKLSDPERRKRRYREAQDALVKAVQKLTP